jgi:hypothetical protein
MREIVDHTLFGPDGFASHVRRSTIQRAAFLDALSPGRPAGRPLPREHRDSRPSSAAPRCSRTNSLRASSGAALDQPGRRPLRPAHRAMSELPERTAQFVGEQLGFTRRRAGRPVLSDRA